MDTVKIGRYVVACDQLASRLLVSVEVLQRLAHLGRLWSLVESEDDLDGWTRATVGLDGTVWRIVIGPNETIIVDEVTLDRPLGWSVH